MLHIILGILKIIAIVLGILLLILLALILSVLFVPVRYRLELVKQPAGEVRAQARVSWLLHMISVQVSFQMEQGLDLAIRLFGIRLPFFRRDSHRGEAHQAAEEPRRKTEQKCQTAEEPSRKTEQKRQTMEEPCRKTEQKRQAAEKICQEAENRKDTSEPFIKGSDEENETAGSAKECEIHTNGQDTDDTAEREVHTNGQDTDDTAKCEIHTNKQDTDDTASSGAKDIAASVHCESAGASVSDSCPEHPEPGSTTASDDAQASVSHAESPDSNRGNGILSRMLHAWQERIRKIQFQFSHFCDRMRKMKKQIGKALSKPEELRKLMEKLEARLLLGDIFEYLRYLLGHFRPRRIEGYLRFGTGDPALSAQLTGVLYLLLPARADRFRIDTEFNDTVLETELVCRGHIRSCHVIRIIWQAFRNKKIRRLIRYLRKKENA